VRRRYIAAAAVVAVGTGLGSFAFLSPARASSPADEVTASYNGNTYGTGQEGVCNVAAGGTCDETATCPDGTYATGGGEVTYTSDGESLVAPDLVVMMSEPYPGSAAADYNTGWRVVMRNTGSETEGFQAWVMCLEGSS
jgi:hypothetical protein